MIEGPAQMLPIAAFCARNPQVQVRYILSSSEPIDYLPGLLWCGIPLSSMLKGKDLCESLLPADMHGDQREWELDNWVGTEWFGAPSSLAAMDLPNFGIFPLQISCFNEELQKELSWYFEALEPDACHEIFGKWREYGI